MFSSQEYFQQTKLKIDQELEKNLINFLDQVNGESDKLNHLTEIFAQSNKGGKRLRGFLVRLGYEMAKGDENEEIYKVAVACEIFQTAILTHDDIIDQSPLRRGKPTIFHELGSNHYAISQTIALGDLGFFLAVKILAQTNFPEDKKSKAIELFSIMMEQTTLGELLDVELPYLKEEKRENDVLTIHKLKTAYYTIVYPLSLGFVLGGGDENSLVKIKQFGESLGIGFQIQDDILGVFGDEDELGKSVSSDIEEGKNTLLIVEALKNSSPQQKEVLNRLYGKKGITLQEVEQVRQIFVDTGAIEYSEKKAQEYIVEAKKMIPELTEDSFYKQVLEEMAEYLIKRQK